MRHQTPLLTDIDDVALNWLEGFADDMSVVLGRKISASDNTGWDLREFLGIDDPIPHINRFNASPAFGRLQAYACAKAVLTAAAERNHPVVAITACSDEKAIHQLRIRNLEGAFGDIFTDIRFVPLGGSKDAHLLDMLEGYGQPGVWVEDNHKHALAGAAIGHKTFVIRRSHNRALEAGCTSPLLHWIDDYYPVGAHLDLPLLAQSI